MNANQMSALGLSISDESLQYWFQLTGKKLFIDNPFFANMLCPTVKISECSKANHCI
jgi:hypothetical protein